MAWARLMIRLQALELVAFGIVVAVLVFVVALAAWRLQGIADAFPECLPAVAVVGGQCASTGQELAFWHSATNVLAQIVWALPFIAGVVLGAPTVAREVETRTSLIAWSISPARATWFLRRIWPISVLLLVGLLTVAAAMDLLAHASLPRHNLSADFIWYEQRGIIVPARGLFAFAVGVLGGAILGRVLPALIVGAAILSLAWAGLAFGIGAWHTTDAVAVPYSNTDDDISGLALGWMLRTEDGNLVTLEEGLKRGIIPRPGGPPVSPPPGFSFGDQVAMVVPGDHEPAWVFREAAVWAASATAIFGLGMLVTSRRRPI